MWCATATRVASGLGWPRWSLSYAVCPGGSEQISRGDVLVLRSAGLDDQEILEAVHAAVLLEICNRGANALGVEPMGLVQHRRRRLAAA
jgi:hypothetical protein